MSNIAAAGDVADVEVVAADGDVILVIGKDKKKLRVSSHALSASPVFKAMLGPHFKEGQQPRDSASPLEIPLPEDHSGGVHLMCKLLHHCKMSNYESYRFSSPMLRHAAVAIQKYQLVDVLRLQIHGMLSDWLFTRHGEWDIDMVIEAVAAAYVLDCEAAFRRATAHVINKCTNGIGCLVDDETVDIIPVRVLLLLESKRNSIRSGDSDVPESIRLCLPCCKDGEQPWDGNCYCSC